MLAFQVNAGSTSRARTCHVVGTLGRDFLSANRNYWDRKKNNPGPVLVLSAGILKEKAPKTPNNPSPPPFPPPPPTPEFKYGI